MMVKIDTIELILNRVSTALNDWLHQYAPDCCEDERVREALNRIQHNGGTLAYIASLQRDIKQVLKEYE